MHPRDISFTTYFIYLELIPDTKPEFETMFMRALLTKCLLHSTKEVEKITLFHAIMGAYPKEIVAK